MSSATAFTPEGGIFGNYNWTSEVSGTVGAPEVAGEKKQSTKLTVDHHVWVYFADAAPKPSYYLLHHMEVAADSSVDDSPLADESDVRGFFSSSVRVAYRGTPTVSAGCTLSKVHHTPRTAQDDFDVVREIIGQAKTIRRLFFRKGLT